MELSEEILNNWDTDIPGYAQIIPSLEGTPYPAWTLRDGGRYGVVLPYDGPEEINETFSKTRILSKDLVLDDGLPRRTLTLTASSPSIRATFASLCAALAAPGFEGQSRREITASPLLWWKNWKEMLGNRNIDPRVYDTLGELCVLREMIRSGKDVWWNGPDGATYDIETESEFVEAKSTIVRDKREVTISNRFQLKPEGKPLWLVLCVFEPSVMTGVTIDGVVEEIANMGYNVVDINEKLDGKGFEAGMSSRRKPFILHEMLRYTVDDDFPRITDESFAGGMMPLGITSISYTVNLSSMPATPLMKAENDEPQI